MSGLASSSISMPSIFCCTGVPSTAATGAPISTWKVWPGATPAGMTSATRPAGVCRVTCSPGTQPSGQATANVVASDASTAGIGRSPVRAAAISRDSWQSAQGWAKAWMQPSSTHVPSMPSLRRALPRLQRPREVDHRGVAVSVRKP